MFASGISVKTNQNHPGRIEADTVIDEVLTQVQLAALALISAERVHPLRQVDKYEQANVRGLEWDAISRQGLRCAATRDVGMCTSTNSICKDHFADVVENNTGMVAVGSTNGEQSTERPVNVLYYVGVSDIVCNPLGVQQTLEGLRWRGSVEFHAVPWVDLPYKTAAHGPGGRVKSARALTLVELEEAGHLVPLNQPAMALQMVKDWLRYLQTGIRLSSGSIKSGSHSAEAPVSKGGFVVQEL